MSSSRQNVLAGTLKKGGSKIKIPAKSTYVEFVPGFFDIKNRPGNTLLTLTCNFGQQPSI